MSLRRIIFPVNDRFDVIESFSTESVRQGVLSTIKGIAKSVVRGGVVGYAAGYLIGGDADSAKVGAYIGAGVDYFQHTFRLFGLMGMSRQRREYCRQFYERWGFMENGKATKD